MSYKPRTFKNDIDCPGCKFGTLIKRLDRQASTFKFKCIDCNRIFTMEELEAKGNKI